MDAKLRSVGVSVALFGAVYGCSVVATDDGEEVASSQSAILGGWAINDGPDPVSRKFPLSTVAIYTPGSDPNLGKGCTGVIIDPFFVLTAAHCLPTSSSTVSLYGNANAQPNGQVNVSAVSFAPCDGGVQGPYPCSLHGVYRDLALIKTATNMLSASTAPLYSVPLGLSGQFGNDSKASFWEVGAGNTDLDGGGVPWEMRWAPTTPILSDSSGTIVTTTLRGLKIGRASCRERV